MRLDFNKDAENKGSAKIWSKVGIDSKCLVLYFWVAGQGTSKKVQKDVHQGSVVGILL